MKNILSLAIIMMIATAPLLAQTKWSGPFTLKVTIEGSQDSVGLFYYDMTQKRLVTERRKFQQGVALFEENINEPAIATIYVGPDLKSAAAGQDNSLKLYLQAGEITIQGKKTLKDATLRGSPITDDFAASQTEIGPYRKQMTAFFAEANNYQMQKDTLHQLVVNKMMDSLNTRLKRKVMPAMVKKYRNSPVGAYLLNNLVYDNYRGEMDTTEIIPLLNQLSPEVRGLLTAKLIDDRINRIRKASQMTGTTAPDFVRSDINGRQIHLSDFRGKYVLVDFWGSWCHPCRKSHPHLKEIYARYKEKGLEIIGVDQELQGDMEAMKKRWRQAVTEDDLTWVQVLNADGIKDFDIVRNYAVEAFPTKLLLDREGRIIDRFVGDDPHIIDSKLDQIFEK